MRGLYIINGLGFSLNTGIGGSDKRAIEVIRSLKDNKEAVLDILTTESGQRIFADDEKLYVNYLVIRKPFFWPNFVSSYLLGRVLSYFYALFASFVLVTERNYYDFYFATSDFFFDIIPGFLGKVLYKKKLICMVHHHIKGPKERSGSLLINSLMFCSQRFSFWFISTTADGLFLYKTEEGKNISHYFHSLGYKGPVFFLENGINSKLIDQAARKEPLYDACFLGGIRVSKGIKEFVPLWKRVTKSMPEAKFVVIGGGSKEIVNMLTSEIAEGGLSDSIILTGPLSGTDLFEKLKSSKVFLFPSHEEGWGIALCEAMYCGLPVVCYDLPAFKVFGESLIKCRVGDYYCMAERVVELLNDSEKRENLGRVLKEIAARYTWEQIALNDLQYIKSIIS